ASGRGIRPIRATGRQEAERGFLWRAAACRRFFEHKPLFRAERAAAAFSSPELVHAAPRNFLYLARDNRPVCETTVRDLFFSLPASPHLIPSAARDLLFLLPSPSRQRSRARRCTVSPRY